VIAGKLPLSQAVQGPVGIVSTTGEVANTVPVIGWYWMFYLVGALSISLAIVNLLPIPALDGGRVLFIGIEVLRRGKRISPEREAIVNLVGMVALLFLMLLVTINDIGNLFH
ncbi:MAG: site-2 protease family protein, partial [Nitrososphaerota archaeon]